jgi:hypothetical protein
VKRAGLNNQPYQRRNYGRRTKPCGKLRPSFQGAYELCVLDADHVGKCQGPIRRSK